MFYEMDYFYQWLLIIFIIRNGPNSDLSFQIWKSFQVTLKIESFHPSVALKWLFSDMNSLKMGLGWAWAEKLRPKPIPGFGIRIWPSPRPNTYWLGWPKSALGWKILAQTHPYPQCLIFRITWKTCAMFIT